MSVKTTRKGGRKTRPARGASRVAEDDVLPEYDFSNARRNPYAASLTNGVVVVTLDPDVARIFPNAKSVNEALRLLARIAAGLQKKPRRQ